MLVFDFMGEQQQPEAGIRKKPTGSLGHSRQRPAEGQCHQDDPSDPGGAYQAPPEQALLQDLLHRIQHVLRLNFPRVIAALPQHFHSGGPQKDVAAANQPVPVVHVIQARSVQ